MIEEAKKWLEQAKADYSTAQKLLEVKSYYASIFFCHQTSEKGLKSIILDKTKNPLNEAMSTHSLIFLGKQAKVPEKILDSLKLISPHYVISRYPIPGQEVPAKLYTESQSKDILEKTKEIILWIEKQLK